MIIQRISTLLNNIYASVLQFLYLCIGHDEEQRLKQNESYREDVAQIRRGHAEIEASLKKKELVLEEISRCVAASDRRIAENDRLLEESRRENGEFRRNMSALKDALLLYGIDVNHPLGTVHHPIPPVYDNNKQKN
jgi:hypothetical protein